MFRFTTGWTPDDEYNEEEDEEEDEDEEYLEEEEEEEDANDEDNDNTNKPLSYEEIAEKKRQLFTQRNLEIQRKTALQNAHMTYTTRDVLKAMDDGDAATGMSAEAKAFLSMKPMTAMSRQKNKVFLPGVKRTRVSRKMRVSAEAEKILGLANMLYVQNFVEEAIEKCHECITVAPHEASPYHTLGLIYEEKGDMAKAMDFYSIAAHVSKKDVELWLRIADMALTLENRRHAIYCLSRAVKASEGILDDAERNLLRLNSADLYEEFGEKRQAIAQYEQIIESLGPKDVLIDPYDVHIKCMSLCMECNLKPNAAKVLGGYARKNAARVDMKTMLFLIDLVSELDWWEKVVEYVELCRRVWEEKGHFSYKEIKTFPLNCEAMKARALIMLSGIYKQHKTDEDAIKYERNCEAKLRVGRMCTDVIMDAIEKAAPRAEKGEKNVFPFPDLSSENLFRLAHAHREHGNDQHKAMEVYKALLIYDKTRDSADVWEKMADCARIARGVEGAKQVYEEICSTRKHSSAARVQLTEIFLYELKDEEKAKEMLPSLEELVNDSVDDNVLLRASELRRSLQNMDDFIRESLPTVQQILDEALDVKAQIQKLRADAKHLQNIEDARNSAYLKKTGGKDGLKKKKQKTGWGGRNGGGSRKEELVPLSKGAFRGFENKRLERNRELDKKFLTKEEVAEIEREIRGGETKTSEEIAAEKREVQPQEEQNEETNNNSVVDDEGGETEKDKVERLQREKEAKEFKEEMKKITDQIDILNKHRDSTASFSHPTQFVMIVQVLHALLLDGGLKEARSILDKIVGLSFPRGLSKEQTVAIRYMRTKLSQLEGNAFGMAEQANKVVTAYPDILEMWNIVLRDGCRNTTNAKKVLATAKKAVKAFTFPGNEFDTTNSETTVNEKVPALLASGYIHGWNDQWAVANMHSREALRLAPNEPNVRLGIACSQIHGAVQTHLSVGDSEKNARVLRAICQLNTMAKQRNDVSPMEATYNAARALHQINLMYLAQPLYEKCLEIKDEFVKTNKDLAKNADLSVEAAYNLSLIYRASGCDDLARAVLKKYGSFR